MATQLPTHTHKDPISYLSSYLGISFALFLTSLPKQTLSLIQSLQTHNKSLTNKLLQAEEQLEQLYSRRKEDSKANARVVEIFASHRHGWQQEEKRLLQQIDDNVEEIANLRAKVEDLEARVDELKREVSERDELLNFMTNREDDDGELYGKLRVSDDASTLQLHMDNFLYQCQTHKVLDTLVDNRIRQICFNLQVPRPYRHFFFAFDDFEYSAVYFT